MKINNELERLLAAEQIRRPSTSVGSSEAEGFENLLAQQLGRPDGNAADPQMLQALADPLRLATIGVATIAGLEGAENGQDDSELVAAITGGIHTTLNGLDKVAHALSADSPDSLKVAWSALQGMDSQLAGLRQNMSQLSKPDAALETMMNELEILAATEKFKFNRGDYL